MTHHEQIVLEAAFDLYNFEQAIDHGIPFHKRNASAYRRLMAAVSDLANENDGELRVQGG
jgi:hypothetical protein